MGHHSRGPARPGSPTPTQVPSKRWGRGGARSHHSRKWDTTWRFDSSQSLGFCSARDQLTTPKRLKTGYHPSTLKTRLQVIPVGAQGGLSVTQSTTRSATAQPPPPASHRRCGPGRGSASTAQAPRAARTPSEPQRGSQHDLGPASPEPSHSKKSHVAPKGANRQGVGTEPLVALRKAQADDAPAATRAHRKHGWRPPCLAHSPRRSGPLPPPL